MLIGVPKETKQGEYRVGLTPQGTDVLKKLGHRVLVEKGAGQGSRFSDKEYQLSGAKIVSAQEAWRSQLVVKVKEPQEKEFSFLRENLILFTYLHLAAAPKLTKVLAQKRVVAIDYATVEEKDLSLPLLKPMSQVAGKASLLIGSHYLEKNQGGKGVLISEGRVLILGGGVVGQAAAEVALGVGAKVSLFEAKSEKCQVLLEKFKNFGKKFQCILSTNTTELKLKIKETDLLVGGVLIPGAKAPKVVTEEMVKSMEPGSVIVDVSIDQGGCVETSSVTTHKNPVFVKHGVIHYGVPNIPSNFPKTSTLALTEATLPYVVKIANNGFDKAIQEDQGLAKGVNVYQGKITNTELARSLGKDFFD